MSGRAIGGPCRNGRHSAAVPHEDEQEDGKGRHAAAVRWVQHTDHGEHFLGGWVGGGVGWGRAEDE